MFQDLNIFQTAAQMAKHAGSRQAVIAQNIANADTPGFQARELAPFKDVLQGASANGLRATRPQHMGGSDDASYAMRTALANSEPSPNGNAVSVEEEMLKSVTVAQDHTRALAIYRHGMTVLRTVLGR